MVTVWRFAPKNVRTDWFIFEGVSVIIPIGSSIDSVYPDFQDFPIRIPDNPDNPDIIRIFMIWEDIIRILVSEISDFRYLDIWILNFHVEQRASG